MHLNKYGGIMLKHNSAKHQRFKENNPHILSHLKLRKGPEEYENEVEPNKWVLTE